MPTNGSSLQCRLCFPSITSGFQLFATVRLIHALIRLLLFIWVFFVFVFFLCCEPEQRETNLRYDSSHKTSKIKEHKQAEQQQSSVFRLPQPPLTWARCLRSKTSSRVLLSQRGIQGRGGSGPAGGSGKRVLFALWSRAISQCVSAVRSTFHESCWVLFPLTYNQNGLGPAERSEVGRFKHNKPIKTDSLGIALSYTFWFCLHHFIYLFCQSGRDMIATNLINHFFLLGPEAETEFRVHFEGCLLKNIK